jgi:hypothetical protein
LLTSPVLNLVLLCSEEEDFGGNNKDKRQDVVKRLAKDDAKGLFDFSTLLPTIENSMEGPF